MLPRIPQLLEMCINEIKIYLYINIDMSAKNLMMNRFDTVQYDETELYKHVAPGDIVLVSGTGGFSYFIQCITLCTTGCASRSKYNHASMVHSIVNNKIMIATTTHHGCDIIPLQDIINKRFYTDIIILRLKNRPDPAKVLEVEKQYHGTPYETNVVQCFGPAFDFQGCCSSVCQNEEDTSKVFCSEYIARMLMDLGVLGEKPNVPSNEYTPEDFIERTDIYTDIIDVPTKPMSCGNRCYNFWGC